MTILKGVPHLIPPKLLYLLAQMGHGDELVLADANFPSESVGASTAGGVVRLDGASVPEVLAAIAQLLPLDTFATPCVVMNTAEGKFAPIIAEYQKIANSADGREVPFEGIDRFAFYDRAKKAYAVVATGETAIYANLILKKGIIAPKDSKDSKEKEPKEKKQQGDKGAGKDEGKKKGQGQDTPKKAGASKKDGAASAASEPAPAGAFDDKIIKAAEKEGGKKAQDLAGLSDMGGIKFFCLSMEKSEGSHELLQLTMDAMNKEVDETAEERRGGAGNIGKMLLSAGDRTVAVLAFVPEELQASLSVKEWTEHVLGAVKGNIIEERGNFIKAEIPCDPAADRFPLKLRDLAIGMSFDLLKKRGLVNDDSSEVDMGAMAEENAIEWQCQDIGGIPTHGTSSEGPTGPTDQPLSAFLS